MAAMDAEGADASQRLDHAMRRLRIRLHPLGLTIGTIRGVGFVLELGSPPDM
jgi:DNA-binding response OmpR family regulator